MELEKEIKLIEVYRQKDISIHIVHSNKYKKPGKYIYMCEAKRQGEIEVQAEAKAKAKMKSKPKVKIRASVSNIR